MSRWELDLKSQTEINCIFVGDCFQWGINTHLTSV